MLTIFGVMIKNDEHNLTEHKIKATVNITDNFRKAVHIRPLYYEIGIFLVVPRFYGGEFINKLKDTEEVAFSQIGKLYEPQQHIVENIMNSYFSKESVDCGRGGLILKLDMGAGKSFISMDLINRVRRKTLIVCHVTNMIDQWKKILNEWFSNCSIGEISGRRKTDGDIVVGLIQTLSKDTIRIGSDIESYKFFSQFSFIIFDEAHLYCSASYSNIFRNCQVPYMLGLSGTPYNKDMSHNVILQNIGPIYDADIGEKQQFDADVDIIFYETPQKYTEKIYRNDNVLNYQAITDLILSNPERIEVLVAKICQLAEHRNVFVFADRRDYLKTLYEKVSLVHVSSLIAGGSTEKALENAENNSKVIFTTYQYMSTGRSIKKMDAIVFATPRKTKVEQTLGRIFRSGSTKKVRIIVDMLDVGTILMSQYKTRKAIYTERKYNYIRD